MNGIGWGNNGRGKGRGRDSHDVKKCANDCRVSACDTRSGEISKLMNMPVGIQDAARLLLAFCVRAKWTGDGKGREGGAGRYREGTGALRDSLGMGMKDGRTRHPAVGVCDLDAFVSFVGYPVGEVALEVSC